MGFRGVINVILRKQIEMSRSFSLVQPEKQLQDVHAPFFLKFFLFFLMHRLLPYPKKKILEKKRLPSTLDPRHGTLALYLEPSTLDKKIDSLRLL